MGIKWHNVALAFTFILAVIFGTLYFAKPRIIEKPIEVVVFRPSPPDTVYIDHFFRPSPPDTVYQDGELLRTTEDNESLMVSEKTFKHTLKYGEINSFIRAYSEKEVYAFSDSIDVKYNMDALKNEICKKTSSKFWPGFAIGAGLVSSAIIIISLKK